MHAFTVARLHTELLAAHVLRSPLFLVIGHVEWLLIFICIAVWLWWPAGILAFWFSMSLARAIGNETWEELTDPLPETIPHD